MSGISLRAAKPGDYDAIAAIWHASAGLPGVGPAQLPSLERLRARVAVEMEAGWRVTAVSYTHLSRSITPRAPYGPAPV